MTTMYPARHTSIERDTLYVPYVSDKKGFNDKVSSNEDVT